VKRATLLAALLLAAVVPATAIAALRSPQVPVTGSELQDFFDIHNPGLNVATDQDVTNSWQKSGSGLTTVTLQAEDAEGSEDLNAIGFYNTFDGARFELWDGNADPDAASVIQFLTGNQFIIHKYNSDGSANGDVPGSGVEPNGFGFYLEKTDVAVPPADPKDSFSWTTDSINKAFAARALVFQGTGAHANGWWVCIEDGRAQNADEIDDFNDAIILVETIAVSPVTKATWATVKARFR
jgi:hypothetical protein